MSRVIRDADGQAMERTRDGDLVPVPEPEPQLFLRPLAPDRLCADHGDLGYKAIRCAACCSEYLAGERPHRMIGRQWVHEP